MAKMMKDNLFWINRTEGIIELLSSQDRSDDARSDGGERRDDDSEEASESEIEGVAVVMETDQDREDDGEEGGEDVDDERRHAGDVSDPAGDDTTNSVGDPDHGDQEGGLSCNEDHMRGKWYCKCAIRSYLYYI